MRGNTFGKALSITTFGESHGPGIGVIIDGCPAGIAVDPQEIQVQMDRRKPGQSRLTTQRKESDLVQIQSGLFEGKTTGTPISLFIANENQRPADYQHIEKAYRPSHADFTYDAKYGFRDPNGGGRSSARETAARVAAAAILRPWLLSQGLRVWAYVCQVGNIRLNKSYTQYQPSDVENTLVRCPDLATARQMEDLIDQVRLEQDTIGGSILCICEAVPAGLGEPVFDKLHADLGKAMLSINAEKGFQIGSGFHSMGMRGSEHNDPFIRKENRIGTQSNHSGGIQGGISNGEDVWFEVGFKPVATIMQAQETLDRDGNLKTLEGKGRHDPCVLPRAVPIVEAMAILVLADHLLRSRLDRATYTT
jgi:chorismate synthase